MSKRSFRTALAIVAGTLLILGGVAWYLTARALSYPHEAHDGPSHEIPVTIEDGMSFPQIASRLAEEDIIDKPRWFRLYAMQRGVTTKVRSGDYLLRGDMTPEKVLDALLEGVREKNISITLEEGLHMLEIFDAFLEAEIVDADGRVELERLARDPEFLEEHGISGPNVDGYLFPETYRFRVPTPPKQILERLIRQHRRVWAEVKRQHRKDVDRLMKKLDWSERDILIMASIVEKEAVVDEERARIAQVFINRLTSPRFNPKRLETDPTIRYGCMIPVEKSPGCIGWDKGDRLRRKQLDDADNPYNTYQHEGLPPGPICNPGRKSLEATVNPDGSKYFFFVARNDGTHVFSRTFAEHERNVDKFQR